LIHFYKRKRVGEGTAEEVVNVMHSVTVDDEVEEPRDNLDHISSVV